MATPLVLAQQVFSALTNNLATNSTSEAAQATPVPFPTDLSSLVTFLCSLSALRDWLKLLVFGFVLESLRRLAFHFYYKLYDSLFITATFEEEDASYDWVMVWLSKQPSWSQTRNVQISTRNFNLQSNAILIEGEDEDPMAAVVKNDRKLTYLPSVSSTFSMWYKRRWVRVTRNIRDGYYGRREESLELCIMSWGNNILNQLLLEAKKEYLAAQEHTISIYVSDSSNNWRHIASRPKRPLKSIVLDPGVKDLLIDDARDFLESKSWYSARGIPFRRGYLLYGAPGSGKTSIIHSLAGELGLDVYVISLSRSGLDDTALSELISELPEKCIALMEDIDAAFSQTMNRDAQEDIGQDKADQPPRPKQTTSKISLSGLLNALDGVGAQEGRILFATTNKYDSLDSALCRPGRMDIHIEFKLASKYQAEELYRCFYLPDLESEVNGKVAEDDSGYSTADNDEKITTPHVTEIFEAETLPLVDEETRIIGTSHRARVPKLSSSQVSKLAARFAEAIPEREFSMASLQGYLMAYKIRPYEAVSEAPAWVEKERAEIAMKKAQPAKDSAKGATKDT
ncbi:hypothetical protein K443DRAFT_564872 [Laccaria amethystina LaAM-08-1]|uniref:P-loop containing nucleoside triphosphate hydrolase protein n=1 Tax=Laccaria amethystina LaAM-08-1 TaxID=1095629 RepID=A0A0C9X8Y3_9AGAR|nr:hypothetical protein K443DRAFT_564872 [Laccaria amethystina LaAM-08-1]